MSSCLCYFTLRELLITIKWFPNALVLSDFTKSFRIKPLTTGVIKNKHYHYRAHVFFDTQENYESHVQSIMNRTCSFPFWFHTVKWFEHVQMCSLDTAYNIVREPTLTYNAIITNHLRAPYGVFFYHRIIRLYGTQ